MDSPALFADWPPPRSPALWHSRIWHRLHPFGWLALNLVLEGRDAYRHDAHGALAVLEASLQCASSRLAPTAARRRMARAAPPRGAAAADYVLLRDGAWHMPIFIALQPVAPTRSTRGSGTRTYQPAARASRLPGRHQGLGFWVAAVATRFATCSPGSATRRRSSTPTRRLAASERAPQSEQRLRGGISPLAWIHRDTTRCALVSRGFHPERRVADL